MTELPRTAIGPDVSHTIPYRLPSLDGLRGISIVMVIFGHFGGWLQVESRLFRLLLTFFGNGGLGVSIFFVISGFLITTLLLREHQFGGRIDLLAFYKRRALRIWPAYFVLILVVAILSAAGIVPTGVHDLAAASFFIWNYAGGVTDSWTLGHTWSLSVEEQFYLLWPLCLLTLDERNQTRLAIAIIVLSPFLRVAIYFWQPSVRGRIPVMLHTRADTLMFGCLLALVLARPNGEAALRRFVARRFHYAATLFILFVSPLLEQRFQGAYILPVGQSAEGAAIAAVLIWLVLEPRTRWGRIVNSRLLAQLGALSYSLYLWQQLFAHRVPGLSEIDLWVRLAALGVIATASYLLVEKPALAVKARLKRA